MMCGIAGVWNAEGNSFAQLMNANLKRGSVGWGVLSQERCSIVEKSIGAYAGYAPSSSLLLGHTLAPTSGSAGLSVDRVHPFESKEKWWLAHNGLLLNAPKDDVDTRWLMCLIENERGVLIERIAKACERVQGQMACWLYATGVLYLWRVMSPLYLFKRGRSVMFSSSPFEGAQYIDAGIVYSFDASGHSASTQFNCDNPYSAVVR